MTAWIDIAGWTLVHFVWQGAAIGAAAAVSLRLLRRAAPEYRYVAACAALAAMLAAPMVTAFALSGAAPHQAPRALATASPAASPSRTTAFRSLPGPHAAAEGKVRPQVPRLPAGANAAAIEPWLPALVFVWCAGVALLLVRLAAGWLRLRRVHRASRLAAPSRWQDAAARIAAVLGVSRAVRVIDSAFVDTPIVFGWLRPVILVPAAALSSLSPAQIEAILAHELAHVQRHDFLANLVQTLAETLLFYHPAVWWVSRRIRAEREHCCDMMAVALSGDPVGYAEALTELETWRGAGAGLAVAASGGSLLERVQRVLNAAAHDDRPGRGIPAVAALVLLVLALGSVPYLSAQAGADADPDAPSPASNEAAGWRMVFDDGTSELNIIGYTGRDLIRFGYQIPKARVLGGPAWIDTEGFRLVTRLERPPAADEMPAIVRRVLDEQLRLRVHVEQRLLPAYALVAAGADVTTKPGLRLSATDCFDVDAWIAAGQPPRNLAPGGRRQPVCGEESWDSTVARTSYVAITMEQFAAEMQGFIRNTTRQRREHQPDVLDRTGLRGRYDIDLHVFAPAAALMAHAPMFRLLLEPLGMPSMDRAIEEQLGLEIEDTTAPYDVIVVDHAERPTG